MDDPRAFADSEEIARSRRTIALDAAAFETVRKNVESGLDRWVGALVRDGEGRIVLVRNRWSDGWVLPGGDVEPDETLREAVTREVREETGLDAAVERPLEVVEQTFTAGPSEEADSSGASGDSPDAPDEAVATESAVSGHFVVFEAQTHDASLGEDLGRDDDEIADAAWFESVPDECEHRALVARHF